MGEKQLFDATFSLESRELGRTLEKARFSAVRVTLRQGKFSQCNVNRERAEMAVRNKSIRMRENLQRAKIQTDVLNKKTQS